MCRVCEEINTRAIGGNADLGVLPPDRVAAEMDGTKRFNTGDLDAVFELKCINNALQNSDYQLQRDGENRLDLDLQRLTHFPDDVAKYFILFSNVALFRETSKADYSKTLDTLQWKYDDVQVHYQHIPSEQAA